MFNEWSHVHEDTGNTNWTQSELGGLHGQEVRMEWGLKVGRLGVRRRGEYDQNIVCIMKISRSW